MAPRSDKKGGGGKKGGSPNRQKGGKDDKNGRGGKKGPGAGKHKSDGGVKKARPQRGGRVDGDGDLDMGANPRERNDKTKGNDRQKGKVGGQASSVLIRVHGLKESNVAQEKNGGVEKLLGWIEKKSQEKAKGKVKIYKNWQSGDAIVIRLSKTHAEPVLALNGFTFAGSKMEFTLLESDEVPGQAAENPLTVGLRNSLKAVLGLRYSAETKFLNLEALGSDNDLVNIGVFETQERAKKVLAGLMNICNGIFKTAKEKQDAIVSISLANNNIADGKEIEPVATTFPHLKNLDLRGNNFPSLEALDSWRNKFRNLEAILLDGNPIVAAVPHYQETLLSWFPRLQQINGLTVRTKEEVDRIASEALAKAIPQNGIDFRDLNRTAENFLIEFFAGYDQNRDAILAKWYDEQSRFSMAVDTSGILDLDSQPPLPWTAYIKSSRNLAKITVPGTRVSRMHTGAAVIAEQWRSFPATKHPSIKDETAKYIVDCHPTPGLVDPTGQTPAGVDGLMVSVHGQFEEHDVQHSVSGLRSFSRVFLLGPGQPGKGPVRVVSDMLSLRAFSRLPDVFTKSNGPANVPGATPMPQDPREAMIAELSAQTGMTAEYAVMCLEGVNGDYSRALLAFAEQRDKLPPQAFIR